MDRLQSSGGRHLASIDTGASAPTSYVVLDDVTGATLETLPVTDASPELVLSGDGSAVFESRDCSLGSIKGREVDRVSGGREVLLPCAIGFGTGRLEPVQGSASVLWVKQSSYLLDGDNRAEVAPRDVTIVAP